MATPINLNRARKQRARSDKKATADENAAKHGRTKQQRRAEEAEQDTANKLLDQHKRDEP